MSSKNLKAKRILKISSPSHQIVGEFFTFALANILLQRGLYSQDGRTDMTVHIWNLGIQYRISYDVYLDTMGCGY